MSVVMVDDLEQIDAMRASTPWEVDTASARTAWAYRQRMVTRRLVEDVIGDREHRVVACGKTMGVGCFISKRKGKHVRTGLTTCGRHRLCAVCGQREAALRGLLVSAATYLWMAQPGHDATFLTVAIPHRRSNTLLEVHDMLMIAWAELRPKLKRFGVQRIAWVVEHSIGENGPHPQIHAVLLLDRDANEVSPSIQGWVDAFLVQRLRELEWPWYVGASSVVVEPCDSPETMGAYLVKFGIGAELAGSWDKQGRAKTSMPYTAIPVALSESLHRRSIRSLKRHEQRLLNSWVEYFELAEGDVHPNGKRRRWHQSFHGIEKLIPGLAECKTDAERMELCMSILPREAAELFVIDQREETVDDAAEAFDADDADWAGEDPGPPEPEHVHICKEAWAAFLFAWFRRGDSKGRLNDDVWRLRRGRWMCRTGDIVPEPELAACWLLDELGTVAGCYELAEIVGAEVEVDELGVRVGMPHEL